MSGIAVVLRTDGAHADAGLIERMLAAMAHRGPDGSGYWIDGPVALGHTMLRTTPEAAQERQPQIDDAAGLVLTFDGRIDNRGELAKSLRTEGAPTRDDTDAELVLRAYDRWGEESPRRILGDFSYAIWDARRRRLFCARDRLGVLPFYYYAGRDRFLAASELHALLVSPTVLRKPNEALIARLFRESIEDREQTLFDGIRRLAPAHYLIAESDRVTLHGYYDIDLGRDLRYRTDDQYAEHFLEIFRESVRCRMRSSDGIAAELSGGLDSSSIVGMAQTLIRDGAVAVDRFETFSLTLTDPAGDERAFIDDVIALWRLKSNCWVPMRRDLQFLARRTARFAELPAYPNGSTADGRNEMIAKRGLRVALSRVGADEWLTGTSSGYADLVREFRLIELVRKLSAEPLYDDNGNHVVGLPARMRLLLKAGLWPFIPQPAQRAIRVARGLTPIADPLLGPRLAAYSDRSFVDGDLQWGLEGEDLSAAEFGIEKRYPFLDSRLVEFAFAIPEEQRSDRGRFKFVLRNAMRELLPESVRERRTKGDFTSLFTDALRRLDLPRFLDKMAIAELRWVNPHTARQLCDYLTQPATPPPSSGRVAYRIWLALALELWYRIVFLKENPGHSAGKSGKGSTDDAASAR